MYYSLYNIPIHRICKLKTQTKTAPAVSFVLVPRTGLEPACLTALPPQGNGSTNFPTWAFLTYL